MIFCLKGLKIAFITADITGTLLRLCEHYEVVYVFRAMPEGPARPARDDSAFNVAV